MYEFVVSLSSFISLVWMFFFVGGILSMFMVAVCARARLCVCVCVWRLARTVHARLSKTNETLWWKFMVAFFMSESSYESAINQLLVS